MLPVSAPVYGVLAAEEFKTQQFMEVFGCSQPTASRAIVRFQEDGVVETVKYGLYRKLVSELP